MLTKIAYLQSLIPRDNLLAEKIFIDLNHLVIESRFLSKSISLNTDYFLDELKDNNSHFLSCANIIIQLTDSNI